MVEEEVEEEVKGALVDPVRCFAQDATIMSRTEEPFSFQNSKRRQLRKALKELGFE